MTGATVGLPNRVFSTAGQASSGTQRGARGVAFRAGVFAAKMGGRPLDGLAARRAARKFRRLLRETGRCGNNICSQRQGDGPSKDAVGSMILVGGTAS